ncbi:MAG: ATP-binding protein [Opitutaceae bacterium]
MSSNPDVVSLRRSLALRLGLWQAILFGAAAAVMFAAVYHFLARTLEAREREALELRAEEYATAFEIANVNGVRSLLDQEREVSHVRSLFVRVVATNGEVTFAKVPDNWIESDTRVLASDGWGSVPAPRTKMVRVPRSEQRDLAIATRQLSGGAVLQVARSTDNRAGLLEPLRNIMWGVGSAAVILSAGAGAWLSWRALRPVREVAATARRIVRTGDLSARVGGTTRDDEVGDLVQQFNTLLERNGNLLQAMREALDNVAHDLRTPLTRLRAGAETALSQVQDSGSREALAECIEETDRIKRLLDALLDVSAAENGVLRLDRELVDIAAMLKNLGDLFAMVAEEKTMRFEISAAPGATVWADPSRLRQALANLVDNALKYTPAGGLVRINAETKGTRTTITVADSGPGIPPGDETKIWRRLYRGDHSRSQRGLGLGLSVVKAMIEAHGGTVAVANRPEGGAVFTVELPAARG